MIGIIEGFMGRDLPEGVVVREGDEIRIRMTLATDTTGVLPPEGVVLAPPADYERVFEFCEGGFRTKRREEAE